MARNALRQIEQWTLRPCRRWCTSLTRRLRAVPAIQAIRRWRKNIRWLPTGRSLNRAANGVVASQHPWHLAAIGCEGSDVHPLLVGERTVSMLRFGATGGSKAAELPLDAELARLGEQCVPVTWDGRSGGFSPAPPDRDVPRENQWLILEGLPTKSDDPRIIDIITRARCHGLRVGVFLPATDLPSAADHDPSRSPEDHLQQLLLVDCVWVAHQASVASLRHRWAESLLATPRTTPPVIVLSGDPTTRARTVSQSMTLIGTLGQTDAPIYYWIDDTARCPFNSGIQRVTRQLARALIATGVRVIPVLWSRDEQCLRPATTAELARLALWNGPPIDAWATWESPGTIDGGWLLMVELPLRHGPATHKRLIQQAHHAGLRCAAVFYDAIPWKMRATYPRQFSDDHRAYLGQLACYDLVLPISRFSHRDLCEYFGTHTPRNVGLERRVRVASLPGEFPECSRTTSGSPDSRRPLTILAVGTIEPRKNHATLIDAFLLATQHTDVPMRLVLAGHASSYDKRLRRSIAKRIASRPNIEWIRDADDTKLRQLYESCDFTVYPSVEEGYGLPIAESLWQGKPCICADFGSMKEVADGGGCLLTDVRDPVALAEAIRTLATSKDMRVTLSQEATTRPVKTWRHYAADVLSRMGECPPRSMTDPGTPVHRPARFLRASQDQPLLSVCISTYNRSGWLDASLQNWCRLHPVPSGDVELLVVDNASTDDTPAVVSRYAEHSNLRYHRNETNVGMLGNLRETALRARGRHVWILGDDDLPLPGTLERVSAVLRSHPEIPLVYLNYAYSQAKSAPSGCGLDQYLAAATPIVPPQPDRLGFIRELCAANENFFTAIYTCVFRKDHAVRAYCQDTRGAPFSTLQTCVPTTWYVLRHLMDESGYWLGSPQLVVNMNVSWIEHAPLWILERVPEVYDLAELTGAAPAAVDAWRRQTLRGVPGQLQSLYSRTSAAEALFDPVRSLGRFRHLPEFEDMRPTLKQIYAAAWRSGHSRATVPPDLLFSDASVEHAWTPAPRERAA
jgi:glycosyltransferase involved in cell wall biosynthesis